MAVSKAKLFDDFLREFKVFYGDVEPSVKELIGALISRIPEDGFELDRPDNVVLLIGEINGEKAEEIIADLWDLDANLPIGRPIEMVLSTDGGEVEGGSAVISVIRSVRSRGRLVNVHVAGYAHSTSFDIVQACDHRSAEPTATFMTHHEHFSLADDASATTHENEGRVSKAHTRRVFQELASRTGRDVEFYMQKVLAGEWYLSAEDALEEGLIDEIVITRPYALTPAREGAKVAVPKRSRARKKTDAAAP